VTTKSIAAIPAESVPFIGVAVLIADTGYELYAACETVKDLDKLYSDLGMTDESPDDVMHSVCDSKLPDTGVVWGGVVENMDQWLAMFTVVVPFSAQSNRRYPPSVFPWALSNQA
jgi:hypothetical protein